MSEVNGITPKIQEHLDKLDKVEESVLNNLNGLSLMDAKIVLKRVKRAFKTFVLQDKGLQKVTQTTQSQK